MLSGLILRLYEGKRNTGAPEKCFARLLALDERIAVDSRCFSAFHNYTPVVTGLKFNKPV